MHHALKKAGNIFTTADRGAYIRNSEATASGLSVSWAKRERLTFSRSACISHSPWIFPSSGIEVCDEIQYPLTPP